MSDNTPERSWNLGKTIKYMTIKAALDDVSNDDTAKQYKSYINKFAIWLKSEGISKQQVIDNPKIVCQQYSDYLYAKYTANTAHTYLSPVTKGLGIRLQDIDKPKRTGRLTKGRQVENNPQGKRELESGKSERLVAFQSAVGIRRNELSKLRPDDVIQTPAGEVYVHVRRGKGGKEQYQYVLPENRATVLSIAAEAAGDRIFSPEEMTNKIDLHSLRAEQAKHAYAYYADRLAKDPQYKVEYVKKLTDYFKKMNNNNDPRYAGHYKRFRADISRGGWEYRCRGESARIARQNNLPIVYNRVALMMVSVFHLSHWRNDVTIKNYMIR